MIYKNAIRIEAQRIAKQVQFFGYKLLNVSILLFFAVSCKEDCMPNLEHFFETSFYNNGKQVEMDFDNVYAPGGKGNIPPQITQSGKQYFYLPIPLAKSNVTYYFEKGNVKDSIEIVYTRNVKYQSEACGKVVEYSDPLVKSTSFNQVEVTIENTKTEDDDVYEIKIYL